MRFALLFSLVIAILAVIFALQNPQMADVQIGTLQFHGSTALILIITFFIGVVVGVLAALPGWFRNRKKVQRLRKRIAEEPAPTTRTAPATETTTREEHHHHEAPPREPSTTSGTTGTAGTAGTAGTSGTGETTGTSGAAGTGTTSETTQRERRTDTSGSSEEKSKNPFKNS